MKPLKSAERDRFTSTPKWQLEMLRDKLLTMADDESLTQTSRELALDEANYMGDVLAFQALPTPVRRAYMKQKVAPWLNNWHAGDDECEDSE